MISELSIIIPALNEAHYLPRLLESITQQAYTGRLQVIVVDGQSTDRTADIARSYADRIPGLLVLSAERNVGHQRNVGARQAKYPYLLFLDADVVLPPTILAELTAKIANVHLTEPFVVGTMHTTNDVTLTDRLFLLIAYSLLFLSWAARIPAINGDFILTTRASHNKINGFAEGALLGEDIDYGLRSVKAGARYKYFLKPKLIASDRRFRKAGRWRLLWLWSRGYLHVLRKGPIFPGEGYEYQFGHYDTPESTPPPNPLQ